MSDTPANRLEQMRLDCERFHKAHPEFWVMFERFTLERISRGFEHYGVAAIFERIRWEAPVGADGKVEWKVNNNFKAFYARRFGKKYPQYASFFRTRQQISEDADASGQPELGPADYPYTNQGG